MRISWALILFSFKFNWLGFFLANALRSNALMRQNLASTRQYR